MEEFEGAIGIDLGTTYSCVAVFIHNNIDVIPNDQGNRTTPSRVAFNNNQILVGDAAFNLSARGVPGVVYDAKRLIGREFSDSTVQSDMKGWPFTVSSNAKGRVVFEVEHQGKQLQLEPQQVSAQVLEYLKTCAERHLGKKVRRAVITVPAYFNDAQRQATRDAGAIAGLEVLRIINEPTAAALCYGLGVGTAMGAQGTDKAQNVLVFDFGGGTFDVSIITIDSGAFEVRSTAGDTHLGGQDIDQSLLQFFLDDIQKKHRVDFSTNAKIKAKLRSVAEKAKRALSHTTQEEVSVDGIIQGDDYVVQLSRAKFDEINHSVFQRCLTMVKKALADAQMKPNDIDEVIMVGGSSRIPKIREMVSQFFNNKKLCTGVNPDEAIAVGAAIQASILSTAPEQKSDRTAGVVLMDVVSLSIGLDVDEGKFDVLIPRNTTIPYTVTKEFSTAYNNQTEVDVEIFEGERPLTKHNHKLGSFTLDDITKARKGVPTITITLSVDANGCLTVTAEESTAKKTKSLVVECRDRLSTEEVEKMIADAQAMKATDDVEVTVLETTKDLNTALEELQSKVDDLPAGYVDKHESLKKRLAFLQPARDWVASRAVQYTDTGALTEKSAKIFKFVTKAMKAVKKTQLKLSGTKKRRRDSDDEDDDEDEDAEDGGDDDESDDSANEEEEEDDEDEDEGSVDSEDNRKKDKKKDKKVKKDKKPKKEKETKDDDEGRKKRKRNWKKYRVDSGEGTSENAEAAPADRDEDNE